MTTTAAPQTTRRPAAAITAPPTYPAPTRPRTAGPPRTIPEPPDTPPWAHRLLPATVRGALAGLGCWQNPTPQPPSLHLLQVIAVLQRYGWCQSLDTTPTGRLCIRGAQNLLQKTGHVTPDNRERAVAYMQQALAHAGITMQFFAWNDLPDQHFPNVHRLLTTAANLAHQNGQ